MDMKFIEKIVDSIVNVALALVIGIVVLSQLQSMSVIPTAGNNAITAMLDTLGDIPGWIAIIVVVALAYAIKKVTQKSKSQGSY